MVTRVKECLAEYKKIGVAVSGGADSMVLLDLVRKERGKGFTVIHVEHGIRGEASLNDMGFVTAYCGKYRLKCLTYRVDAPAFAAEEGISVELAGRFLRYQIFEELLRYGTLDCVALAHHKDDQAETVLMRILRGTGARGLRGITDRPGYVHPLLSYSKQEIRRYAEENDVPFTEDATNYESLYTRNYIRNELIPLVAERFPAYRESLYKMSKNFAELEDYLLTEITPHQREGDLVFLPATVLERHPAIAKKSVQEALRAAGAERDIEAVHLEAVLSLKDAENNARLNLPYHIDVIKEYERLVFIPRATQGDFCLPFDLEGGYPYGRGAFWFAPADAVEKGVFDPAKIPEGAVVRNRREGDQFKKFGGGTKSLSDFFTDIKMPARLRDGVPLIAKENRVYAVIGVEISDEIKVDKDTGTVYKIIVTDD